MNYLASDTKLGTLAELDRDITAQYKVDLGCTLHVLGTCTDMAPLLTLSRLQAKSMDGLVSNLLS